MVSLTFLFWGGCGRLTFVYVCELFACNIHKGQKEGDGSPGIRVKGSCEPPSECLELRSREEQPVLLSAEPVLQTGLLFLTGNVTASE